MNPPTDATGIPEAAISALSARMTAILGDKATGDDVADFNRLLDMAARSAALEAEIAALKQPFGLHIDAAGNRLWKRGEQCQHERTYTAEATICRRCNVVVPQPEPEAPKEPPAKPIATWHIPGNFVAKDVTIHIMSASACAPAESGEVNVPHIRVAGGTSGPALAAYRRPLKCKQHGFYGREHPLYDDPCPKCGVQSEL